MEEFRFWVAWNMVEQVGAKRFAALIHRFGSAEAAWRAPVSKLATTPGIGETVVAGREAVNESEVDAVIKRMARIGVHIVTLNDASYPANLRNLCDAPPVLYIRGSLEESDDTSVAVVGTRTPTPLGRLTAEHFAAGLAAQGITVVSGLARGIDTCAHTGALSGGGRTIGVLGSGIDVPYPPENAGLMDRMAEQGAVMTEFCPGTPPVPGNFPARNRVISGLSRGVLVVEAAHDSGSLITAGHALEQGREVFAIPGTIGSELSCGPNTLIKQGARLVERVEDILDEMRLPALSGRELKALRVAGAPEGDEKTVLKHLAHDPQHLDAIVRASGVDAGTVLSALLGLELKGLVRQMPGRLFCRVR